MSPVERTNRHAGKALLVAAVGVGFALGMAFLFAVLANRGSVDVRLGDDEFEVGRIASFVDDIDETGIPLIFQDPANFNRPIFVQHLGDEAESGWLAFSAFDPNDTSCIIEWSVERELFVNTCDDTKTYPPDGTGLRQYDVRVEDGRLYVDLNAIERQRLEQEAEDAEQPDDGG